MIRNIPQTFRNIRRAHDVVHVLVRYGFDDVVQETGLDRLFQGGRRALRLVRQERTHEREPRAVRLRKAMEELGPTFIKLGQILSTRPDLIPPEWAEEFTRLQDNVGPVAGEKIIAVIHAELGARVEELFEHIEPEALAAASIAQVHRARMRDGSEVVLKVLRPGIREVLAADMELLVLLADFVERHFRDLGFSPVETVDQFQRELRRETDYRIEARSTERMRADFEGDPEITFPRVYRDASTASVLCLEFIDGQLLSKHKPGDFSPAERGRIVRNGTRAVFRQCLELGFFHADPHPGNIVVLRDAEGSAGPICFIDCGMTAHIDPKTAQNLADIVQGAIGGEIDRVIDVVIDMTDADPMIGSDRAFRAEVWEFISHFRSADLRSLQMGALLREFFDKLQRNDLRCPADIVFLIKAITTIEGVGEALCPDFDIVAEARPSIERLIRRRYGIRALRRRIQNAMLGYAEIAETAPREIEMLLTAVRRQKLAINLEHRGLHDVTRTVEHGSRNIARALIITALLVSSSVLVLADSAAQSRNLVLSIGAGVGFTAAIAVALWSVTFGARR
jgi:ubiquinone biosynthesis protein